MAAGAKNLRTRVLLVEGDDLVRSAMASFLEAKDCVLTVCPTASRAIEALKEERYDLIICDLAVANEDCTDLFGLSGSRCPAAKRVLMTSPKETPLAAVLNEFGIDAVMEKPLTPKNVEDCLVQLAQGR